jgi:hypothetical protein
MGGRVSALRKRNYDDPSVNSDRRAIMQGWRRPVFQGLDQAEWFLSTYDDSDLANLHLIDSGDWRDITFGSLDPVAAARRIESDATLQTGAYSTQVNFILQRVASLATTPSRMVLVGVKGGPYTVVDGVHRIVASCLYYKVRNGVVLPEKEAYLGITRTPYALRFA